MRRRFFRRHGTEFAVALLAALSLGIVALLMYFLTSPNWRLRW
jgi:hypothetical protein